MINIQLTPGQKLLREALSWFLRSHYDPQRSRAAVRSGTGWHTHIWRHVFAHDLDILSVNLPHRVGGSGGPIDLMIIAGELGAALVIEPFIDTVVIGAGLLHRLGAPDTDSLLRSVISGDAVLANTATEPGSGHPRHTAITARRHGEEWLLHGAATTVTSAPIATHLLLSARTSDVPHNRNGPSVFLVELDPANPPAGLTLHPCRTIDDRACADLVLTGLRLPAHALLGAEGAAGAAINQVADEASTAICAETIGCMRYMLTYTIDHVLQPGQPAGGSPVIRHRIAGMRSELERATAATHLAVLSLDAGHHERVNAVATARATVAQVAQFIGQVVVQLHASTELPDQPALAQYHTRLIAIQRQFGTAARYHVPTTAAAPAWRD